MKDEDKCCCLLGHCLLLGNRLMCGERVFYDWEIEANHRLRENDWNKGTEFLHLISLERHWDTVRVAFTQFMRIRGNLTKLISNFMDIIFK